MDETLAFEIGDEAAGLMYLENTYAKGYSGYLARMFHSYGHSFEAAARRRHPSSFGKVAA
jgi:hypothetical protein